MRSHRISPQPDSPLTRIAASANPTTLRQLREAALEILTGFVAEDRDFLEAQRAFHAALEKLKEPAVDFELRDDLESAFNLAYGRAARAVARAWLAELGAVPVP